MTAPAPLHNLEAEHAILGAVLVDAEALRLVRDLLRPADFSEPLHQRLWAKMVEEIEANHHVAPAILSEAFRGDKGFQEMGAGGFLADLFDQAPPTHTAPDYARVIADLAVRRMVEDVARSAMQRARDPATSGVQAASDLKREIEAIEQGAALDDDMFVDAETAAAKRLDELIEARDQGRTFGLRCGLSCVDKRLGGLLPTSLVVIAGRPGMGKTALLGNILNGAAKLNPDKLFAGFSLEMGADQLSDRALSRLTRSDSEPPIPYERLTKGIATPMELSRLRDLRCDLPRNLLLYDRPGISLERIARAVWWLKRKGDLGAIGIDYLQIMRRPKAEGRNDAAVIGEITSGLKALALDARITILLLSQLSRSVEQREDKRPMLSDLRESGSIEQDADSVLFPYREVYYRERAEPKEGTAQHMEWEAEVALLRDRMDVISPKNRHGGPGTERQTYEPRIDLIDNYNPLEYRHVD